MLLKLADTPKTKKTITYSQPTYQEKPPEIFEEDIIKSLKETSDKGELDKEHKEILELMTSNRERTHYKNALTKTMNTVMYGKEKIDKKDKEDGVVKYV
jgi:hypothetical protein